MRFRRCFVLRVRFNDLQKSVYQSSKCRAVISPFFCCRSLSQQTSLGRWWPYFRVALDSEAADVRKYGLRVLLNRIVLRFGILVIHINARNNAISHQSSENLDKVVLLLAQV